MDVCGILVYLVRLAISSIAPRLPKPTLSSKKNVLKQALLKCLSTITELLLTMTICRENKHKEERILWDFSDF